MLALDVVLLLALAAGILRRFVFVEEALNTHRVILVKCLSGLPLYVFSEPSFASRVGFKPKELDLRRKPVAARRNELSPILLGPTLPSLSVLFLSLSVLTAYWLSASVGRY